MKREKRKKGQDKRYSLPMLPKIGKAGKMGNAKTLFGAFKFF
jgi:hypothetical protein